ncbi:MAG: DUF111 family protein, partial [Nanoarchaeota archaeon]|nr:DUF111 family protein [Nanoarchaeota archaeon]
ARKIIEETGSLGVRIIPVKHRLIAARQMESVKIIVKGIEYQAPVKIARDTYGVLLNISAEFEDCKKIADATGITVKEVMRGAEEEARKIFK